MTKKSKLIGTLVLIVVFFAGANAAVTVEVPVYDPDNPFVQPVMGQVPSNMPLTPDAFKGEAYAEPEMNFVFKAKSDTGGQVYIEVLYCSAEEQLRSDAVPEERIHVEVLKPGQKFVSYNGDAIKTEPRTIEEAKTLRAEAAAGTRECVVWRSEKYDVAAGDEFSEISIPWDGLTAFGKSLSRRTINVDILDETGEVLKSRVFMDLPYFRPRLTEFDYDNNIFYTLFPYDVKEAAIFYVEEDPEILQEYIDGWYPNMGPLNVVQLNRALDVSLSGPLEEMAKFYIPQYDKKSARLSDETSRYNPKENNFTQYSLYQGGLQPGSYMLFILWHSKMVYAFNQYTSDAFAFAIPYIIEEAIPEDVDTEVPLYAYPPSGLVSMLPAVRTANNRVFKTSGTTCFINSCEGGMCEIYNLNGQMLRAIDLRADQVEVDLRGLEKGMYLFKTTDREGNKQTDRILVY